jgi:hypothetical protein
MVILYEFCLHSHEDAQFEHWSEDLYSDLVTLVRSPRYAAWYSFHNLVSLFTMARIL